MEFVQGQVFNMEKLTQHIKNSKEKKQQKLLSMKISEDFNNAADECAALNCRIEYNNDRDLLEADIYRLKAAEIMRNYHIKSAKQHYNSQQGGQL